MQIVTQENGRKLIFILVGVVCSFLILPKCFGQKGQVEEMSAAYIIEKNTMHSIFCCENDILASITAKGYRSILKFKPKYVSSEYTVEAIQRRLKIQTKSGHEVVLKSRFNDISEWNDIVDWKSITYGTFQTARQEVLIAIAPIAGASGLETNFYKYLIVDLNTGEFVVLQSLCNDHRFFYSRENKLSFYIFDYSEEFLKKKDFDNISLNIHNYGFKDGMLELRSTITKKCNCKPKHTSIKG